MEINTLSGGGGATPRDENRGAFTKSRFLIVFLCVLFLVGGWLLSFVVDPYLPPYASRSKKGYKIGYEAARLLVEQSTIGKMFYTHEDVRMISGIVVSRDSNSLTIHVGSLNPFDDPGLADRVISISSSTAIFRLEPKDLQVFQSEIYTYFNQPAFSRGKQPEPFFTTNGSLADIEVGTPLTITSPVNINALKSFPAQQIDIQYRARANTSNKPPTVESSSSTSK